MDHRPHRLRPLLAAAFVVAVLASLLGLAGPAGAAPANDNFANRETISGTKALLNGSNVDATAETGEPGGAGATSIWYSWTAPFTGPALLETASSTFDTYLAVYTGNAVNALTLIASDDDSGPTTRSRIELDAVQGTTYRIQVRGFGGAVGNVVLALNFESFNDVGRSHPFWRDIEWAAREQLVQGYPDGGYHPAANISRAAMSALLYRLAGSPSVAPGGQTFSDVSPSHPFYDEIEWMNDVDITNGYSDGTYRPNAPVTRGAMSAFIYRFADESPFDPPGSPTFDDVGLDHPFFTEVEWMAFNGISTGYAGNVFKPGANVSRAAMAAFLHRFDVYRSASVG